MKYELGHAKPSSYDLPDTEFIYGKKSGAVQNQRQGQMKGLLDW